jgi:hypothetical protein
MLLHPCKSKNPKMQLDRLIQLPVPHLSGMDHYRDVDISFGGESPQLRDGIVLGIPPVELVAANDVMVTLE